MAAEDEGRTEEASEYKLEKARKEGRVAKSQEVSGGLVLLLCVLVLVFLGKSIFEQLSSAFKFYFTRCHAPDFSDRNLISAFFQYFLRCVIPVAIVGIVGALAGNILQTRGFIFSTKPIEPKLSKITPKIGEYLKKTIFSGKGLFNVAKSFLKVGIIIFVGYFYIKRDLFILVQIISNGQIMQAIAKIATMASQILITVAVIFLAISIPDYFVQKRDFMEEMKMTKQEQKEEYKELEGDPDVKGRLQQMQRQLLSKNVVQAVSESDVVITNPEHFAVALKYDQEVADSPQVTAKGQDEMAQTIKRIARENDVPIVENRPVARGLYTDVEVGAIIPESYYKVIAIIYSQILNNSE